MDLKQVKGGIFFQGYRGGPASFVDKENQKEVATKSDLNLLQSDESP